MRIDKHIINIIKKISIIISIIIIISVNIIRFIGLEQSPVGFQVDELGSAVTIQCMATEGKDALGRPFSLFEDLNFGTPKPPTYIYPGLLWTKLFGFSIASFRAYSGFYVVMAIIGLFFLARLLFGIEYALLTVLTATISPWIWTFSRVAFESILSPCYLVWGIYFFLRSNKHRDLLLSGILLSFAMYSYPPTRAQLPLLLFPLILFKKHFHGIKKSSLITFFLVLIIINIPLIYKTINGELQGRFNRIGIISDDYLSSIGKEKTFINLLTIFIHNYLLHFSPNFLFLKGDANYIHSTQFVGELSWLDTFALGVGIIFLTIILIKAITKKKIPSYNYTIFILFLITNIAIGIIPSALTWLDLPHALRTIGAWPFSCMLFAFILWQLIKKWSLTYILIILIATTFISFYLYDYFTKYPIRSYGMFCPWAKTEAVTADTDIDWLKFMIKYRHRNMEFVYYLMNYKPGETCSSALKKWRYFHQERFLKHK